MINIVCLKWGDKYGPEYVNKLFNQCKKFINTEFEFYCATDNPVGINPQIQILDFHCYESPESKWGGKVFTSEKVKLISDESIFDNDRVLLLDLDILILKDLTQYLLSYNPIKPAWILNWWQDEERFKKNYGTITCRINASFIYSTPQAAAVLHDRIFGENYDYFAFKFKALDKVIQYNALDLVEFHDNNLNLFYSYNIKEGDYKSDMKDYHICLFNNSHGTGKDLHEVDGWAKEYWESFNEV
jgi:hypothetical protein